MAHSLSAKKRIRQNEKRRQINKARRTALKTSVRKATDTLTGADAQAAEQQFRAAAAVLDREANRGLIHRNTAARKKSQLARKLNALKHKLHA